MSKGICPSQLYILFLLLNLRWEWAQCYKAGSGVCGGPAVLVCFTESSGRITLYRSEFTSVAKSWTFSWLN